ncbi:MAG: hypothetical protein ACE5HS_11625 [bacterium]
MREHRYYPHLKITFFLILLALIWNCGEGPTQVDVQGINDPPDTIITKKSLVKVELETDTTGAVLNLNTFTYTVEFTGLDLDGKVDSFQVKINDGGWSPFSTKTTATGNLEFVSEADQNTVFVRGKDDQGDIDPTPASAVFVPAEFKANAQPSTAIDSGPANGQNTGPGVTFALAGSDEDGSIVEFRYSVDGGAETTVAADANGKATVEFKLSAGTQLSDGNHVFSAVAVDNLGAADPSPETRSFLVSSGFTPVLSQTGGPGDGGAWFTGVGVPFSWQTTTSHYAGAIDHFEYSLNDPVNFTNTIATSVDIAPQPEGTHTFRLRAIDTGGGISNLIVVNFDVATPSLDQGILVVNTTDPPTYGSQINDHIAMKSSWGNHSVAFWDAYGTLKPATVRETLDGQGAVPAGILGKYSTVVFIGNDFAGGAAFYQDTPVLPYLLAGGNVLLGTRNLFRMIDNAQADYFGAGFFSGGGTFNIPGVVPDNQAMVDLGLVAMDFISNAGATTALFDQRSLPKADGTLISIFKNEGTFSIPVGVGGIADPDPGANPTNVNGLLTDFKGVFGIISGRPYRYNHEASATNYDIILTTFFNEQN